MKLEFHDVDVHGLGKYVVSAGDGPAVILMHGFPDTHAIWRHQIPVLAASGLRVIAPDMRGYGNTDCRAGLRYERLGGAGHWMQLSATDRLNALLLDFLRGA